MRIAIVTDIHGNLSALEAVVADLKQASPDLTLHGGDLAVNGWRPAQVVDRVQELGWPGVVGNTDEALWNPGREAELDRRMPGKSALRRLMFGTTVPWTAEQLGEDRIAWLQSLHMEHRTGRLALIHASPGDTWVAPQADATDEELRRVYAPLGTPLVVYAHIHVPFIRDLGNLTVANTGSVGLPFDGDRRASYLLIDGDRLEIRRVAYDVDREIAGLLASKLPVRSWIAATLTSARFVPPPFPE